jgi:hypothetical protein
MSQFEFFMELAAVVVAVAMTEIVAGFLVLGWTGKVWVHGAFLALMLATVMGNGFAEIATVLGGIVAD